MLLSFAPLVLVKVKVLVLVLVKVLIHPLLPPTPHDPPVAEAASRGELTHHPSVLT